MMDDINRPSVSRTTRLLGFAGLLPQLAAVVLIALGRTDPTDLAWIPLLLGYVIAMLYAGLILSFLGGIWWGFAMRRTQHQGMLAAIAVVPSLVALVLVGGAAASVPGGSPWFAVALGFAIMLTLLVDRHLVRTGEAPAQWMRLRVPLSLGLGALTIAAAALLPS